jgi:hypothetical protein
MRQLLPFPLDPVDPATLYDDLPSAGARPTVRLNMIASIDGATAVAGLSGGLGGPADQALFAVLRGQEDPGRARTPGVLGTGPGWRLRTLCEQDGFLFLRYRPQ